MKIDKLCSALSSISPSHPPPPPNLRSSLSQLSDPELVIAGAQMFKGKGSQYISIKIKGKG